MDFIIGYHGPLLVNYPFKPSDSAKCNRLIITQLKQMQSVVGGLGRREMCEGGGDDGGGGGLVVVGGWDLQIPNISSGN